VLNLEDYLKGVVPAELSPAVYPEIEAIKAQAVAARTYAVKHLGQFSAEGFDICDTPACQVYRGASVEQRMGNEAIAATAGELLTYDGEPVDALYTSTCGGRTEDVQNVFPESQPYLVSRLCYVESPLAEIRATAGKPVSQEVAGAVILGMTAEEELAGLALSAPATAGEFARWSSRAFVGLGQRQCQSVAGGNGPVTTRDFARALADALCWNGRLPFLLSPLDTDRLVPRSDAPGLSEPERRMLAHWIEEGVVQPPKDGLDPERPLSRLEVLESLYRLLASRGEAPLRPARFLGVEGSDLRLEIDDSEELLALAPRRYLFRRVGEWTYYSPLLSVMPDDRVLFHSDEEGIDLLVLLSRGGSFDRSSRFSRWVVRKTSAELTESVNARASVGEVTDLRPIRYGKSGRVAELEVVGTGGSAVLTGLGIRWGLGIRENLFFVDRQLGPDSEVTGWVFTGRGWGHGVGLCQVGAYGMAASGHDYKEILAHYYPGTQVLSLREPAASAVR
jgi:stage II sporulation protein D